MVLTVGDRVRGKYRDSTGVYITYTGVIYDVYGTRATVKRDDGVMGTGSTIPGYGIGWIINTRTDGITWGSTGSSGEMLEIITDTIFEAVKKTIESTNNQTNNKMGLLSKMAELVAKEPWKTFKKLGITNGDDLLTNEGRELYIQWKFKQDAEKFAEEVATPMLEAQEKENSKK